ncbi:MAG: diacylglycerol kinase [Spirochaetes bacterium]|nr:diacylglycerol kinase [Spirochaetota bacterium]
MDYYFINTISKICEHSLIAKESPLRCMIILNPVAGGFIDKKKWEHHVKTLKKYQQKAQANPKRQIYKNVILNLTEGKGSAAEITKTFIERAEKDPIPFYLIISAGGDGTHREVMNTLFGVSAPIRRSITVLRLPMGTGNDGADSPTLAGALDLLLNPVHIEFAPAVQLTTAHNGTSEWKKQDFFAFNILSMGLDAYVTHMTNIKKGNLGNGYQLWIDMAALSYESKYKVDYFDVRAFDINNKELLSFREKLLLLAMGVTGNRTYGSQQHILPDYRNVCGIKKMPFFRKIRIKNQVTKGKHVKNRDALLFNAHRLEVKFNQPILAQMDGETVLLQPDDFPAIIQLTAPVIPLIKLGDEIN